LSFIKTKRIIKRHTKQTYLACNTNIHNVHCNVWNLRYSQGWPRRQHDAVQFGVHRLILNCQYS
jgi:hypothetical protein